MSVPGAGCGMVCKTGVLLMIETTWEFRDATWLVASLVLASFVRQLNYRTGLLKSGVLIVSVNLEFGSPWYGLSRVLGVP